MSDKIAEPLSLLSTVWEKCWQERLCVDYLGCTPYVRACIRILEKDNTYYIQLSILGQSVEYRLASLCYPVYTIGIGSLEACTKDLSIDTDSQRLSFNLLVRLCIGKWGVERCWKLAEERVSISWLTVTELKKIDPDFVFDEDLFEKTQSQEIAAGRRPGDYKVYLDDNSEQYE